MPYEPLIGVIGFIVMLLLVVLDIPILAVMFLVAFAGLWLINGFDNAFIAFTTGPFYISASYSFAVIPMFVLMGELAGASKIVESAFNALNLWIGNRRGGLLMATIGAYALFGAVSGVPTAATVIFTENALPEMERYKYNKQFAMATIASTQILTILIPPSVPIVFFCVLVDLSIGRTLIGAIVPGIITMAAFMLLVRVIGVIHPKDLPVSGVTTSWREKFASLNMLWPVLFLFILVTGGIYAGIFPPTVGGAIGSAGTLIYALVRRVEKRRIYECFWNTVVINSQLFVMMIAGFMFTRFIGYSGVVQYFSEFITTVNVSPYVIMLILFVFYIFMGIIADAITAFIITLPVVFPLVVSLGFDPYVFVIVIIFMQEIGGLTPPLGTPPFIVASVARVNPMEVFRRIWPFIWLELGLCWLFIFVPGLITWLPDIFYK